RCEASRPSRGPTTRAARPREGMTVRGAFAPRQTRSSVNSRNRLRTRVKSVVRTEKLTKRFGALTAVDGIDLDVHEGEVFGFLGPNGAGKTTTLRLLCALIAPSSGTAEIAGFRLGRDDPKIRAAVGILTEQPGLYERQSAWHNLDEADRLCDRIAFFRHRVLRIAEPDELRAELYGRATEIRLMPRPRAEDLVRVQAVAGVREAHLENGSIVVASEDPLRTNPLLVKALVDGGAEVAFVTERRAHLEDVYLKIVEPIE